MEQGRQTQVAILSKTPPRSLGWAPTRWSILANLDDRKDPQWEASWNYLAQGYRKPMEVYARRLLARAPGGKASAQDAGDVVQDFLTTCIEADWLSRADPEQGRFRAYMQTLLRRYVRGWLRHRLAQKRRPAEGRYLVSLLPEDEDAGPSEVAPQDIAAFDRSWTDVAVEHALARLQEENERYHVVIHDLICTGGEGSPDIADRVGLRPAQFPVLKHRARKRFSDLFEEELRSTVCDDTAFEDEWKALQPYMP
jgi:RNA polymerase sigma factor (sigma-70 family)